MTDAQRLSTLDALALLTFTMHARLEEAAAREGMSVTQMRLLGVLRDREPTVGELADHLGLSRSSVSGLLDRASQRGYVSRIPDAQDGRSLHVRLEPPGRALIEGAVEQFEQHLAHMLSALKPAEREQWAALTERMLRAEIGRDPFAV